jgi:hypothetical protein
MSGIILFVSAYLGLLIVYVVGMLWMAGFPTKDELDEVFKNVENFDNNIFR